MLLQITRVRRKGGYSKWIRQSWFELLQAFWPWLFSESSYTAERERLNCNHLSAERSHMTRREISGTKRKEDMTNGHDNYRSNRCGRFSPGSSRSSDIPQKKSGLGHNRYGAEAVQMATRRTHYTYRKEDIANGYDNHCSNRCRRFGPGCARSRHIPQEESSISVRVWAFKGVEV